MTTMLTATITADVIDYEHEDTGVVFDLGATEGDTIIAKAWAFDDDGERYYNLDVVLPVVDDDATDRALERLSYALERYAGVTYIRFPGRPHLDLT